MTNKKKTNKKPEKITQTIIDLESMTFNNNHDMWYTEVDDEVIDMYSYGDFIDYISKIIQHYWDMGYSAVSIEEAFRITFIFMKGKVKKTLHFMMSDSINKAAEIISVQ